MQPWGNKHLGGARQGRRGAGDQRASPRCRIHRLQLERHEAVGWIWSLADFTQPVSLEVWWPKRPHRAGRTCVPSQGRENVCASAGDNRAEGVCTVGGSCIPASLPVPTVCLLLPPFSCLTSELFCPPGHLITPVWPSVEGSHGTISQRWVVILPLVTPTSLGFVFLLVSMQTNFNITATI